MIALWLWSRAALHFMRCSFSLPHSLLSRKCFIDTCVPTCLGIFWPQYLMIYSAQGQSSLPNVPSRFLHISTWGHEGCVICPRDCEFIERRLFLFGSITPYDATFASFSPCLYRRCLPDLYHSRRLASSVVIFIFGEHDGTSNAQHSMRPL